MYKRSVTERRRLPHRHGSVVKTLVKSTAMALGMSSLLWGGAAFAEAVPPFVTIESLEWAGSGCPAGTVAGGVAPDEKAFTLAFAEYIASAGPGIPITENRKNCNLIVRLSFPQGWSFTIFDVDYRGFASLDRNVKGTQRSDYFFEGGFPSTALQTTINGIFDGNYAIRDTLGLTALVWWPCGEDRALNINTEVRVNNRANRNGFGLITTDAISGQLSYTYGLRWKRCPD